MTPAQILIKEHGLIVEGINLFETGVNKFEAGQKINRIFFQDLIIFFKGYADQTHHGKEEKIFFPVVKKHPDQNFRSCVKTLLQEHGQARNYIIAVEQSIGLYYNGDAAAKHVIVTNAKAYIQLLCSHIQKENQCFINIENALPADQQTKVNDGFDKIQVEEIGEGVHDKYLEILENARIVLRI